ncbi:MAG: hypothetical protein C5B49_06310 [Bdellovibrio sp.]|nr:MAG: hypothetical protein C5B49_06310 [Bdellovibrio sp.]
MNVRRFSLIVAALSFLSSGYATGQVEFMMEKKDGRPKLNTHKHRKGKVSDQGKNAPTCTDAKKAEIAAAIASATPNMDCTLVVPPNPLTAEGLATPWMLKATNPQNGPCHQLNPNQSAFVEASIFDPKTNKISVYHPLVIDQGTAPLVQPTRIMLPPGAVVGLWIGSNATFARLQGFGNTLSAAHCIQGLNGDNFGQVSACNATAFFAATKAAVASGALVPPPLGVATTDGLACPTTRDFFVVDQDQSDNVLTKYLSDACGNTAQLTPANAAALTTANQIFNGSDNGLLGRILTALGCSDWKVTDVTDATGATLVSSQAIHELRADTLQDGPLAMIPLGDPMALLQGEPNNQNGVPSPQKTALLRSLVGQSATASMDSARYCTDLLAVGAVRLANPANAIALSEAASPFPDVGSNLYNFMGARFSGTFSPPANGAGLGPVGCTDLIHQPDPTQLTLDANGVVISTQFNLPNPLPAVVP